MKQNLWPTYRYPAEASVLDLHLSHFHDKIYLKFYVRYMLKIDEQDNLLILINQKKIYS